MTKINPVLYWGARILAIALVIFISLFALDVFGKDFSPIALFMHLVPNFIVLVAVIIAWKWEEIGGLIFIGLGCAYLIFAVGNFSFLTYSVISGPLFFIGILFLAHRIFRK